MKKMKRTTFETKNAKSMTPSKKSTVKHGLALKLKELEKSMNAET